MHAHYGMPLGIVGHAHDGADDPTHGKGGAHTHPQTDPSFGDVVPKYTDAHTHGLAYAAPAMLAALERALPYIERSPLEGTTPVAEVMEAAIALARGQSVEVTST